MDERKCEQCGGKGWYADGPTDKPIQVQCQCGGMDNREKRIEEARSLLGDVSINPREPEVYANAIYFLLREIDRLKEVCRVCGETAAGESGCFDRIRQEAFNEAIEIVNNWLAEEKEIAKNCHPTNKRYSDGRIDAYELTITALESARDKNTGTSVKPNNVIVCKNCDRPFSGDIYNKWEWHLKGYCSEYCLQIGWDKRK